MKTKRLTYDSPLCELIPLLPLECYCGISGDEYTGSSGNGGEEDGFDPDSD